MPDRLDTSDRKIYGEMVGPKLSDEAYLHSCDMSFSLVSQVLYAAADMTFGADADKGDVGGIIQGALDGIVRFIVTGNSSPEALVREMLQDLIDHLLPQAIADRDIGMAEGEA